MSNAVNAADTLVLSVSDLGRQQVNLQTQHIKNENRVNYATEAAIKAKAQADNANTELYHLNKGRSNFAMGTILGKPFSKIVSIAKLHSLLACAFIMST